MVNNHTTSISNASSDRVSVKITPSKKETVEFMVKPGESKKVSTNYGELNVKLSLLNPDNTWYGSRSTQVESHNAPYEQNICCHNSYIIKEENRSGKIALKLVEARYGTLWQEN